MWPEIETDASLQRVYHDIELPTSVVLQKIERNGVLINKDLLNAQSNEIGKRLLELEQNAYELAEQPFNLNSPKQLGEIFFGKLGLPVVKKHPPVRRRRMKKFYKNLRKITRCPKYCWNTAASQNSNRHTPTNCRKWSMRRRVACIPTMRRPLR
jgi:DNA polymerase I-like protein with 3'-5' exonuclease and polymerase domains